MLGEIPIRWNMSQVSVADLNEFQDRWEFDAYGIMQAAKAEVVKRGEDAIRRRVLRGQRAEIMADMVAFITGDSDRME